LQQRAVIDDIQKHCHNKRFLKSIVKMDYVKMGGVNTSGGQGYSPSIFAFTGPNANQQIDVMYKPSVTNASSDYIKLPRLYNDPVVDRQFKSKNSDAVISLNQFEAEQLLIKKKFNFSAISEDLLNPVKKLEAYQEAIQDSTASETHTGGVQSAYGTREFFENKHTKTEELGKQIDKGELLKNIQLSRHLTEIQSVMEHNQLLQKDFEDFKKWANLQREERGKSR
jgi:hypothetical protein